MMFGSANDIPLSIISMANNHKCSPATTLTRNDFPKDFLFGAATSAYQVEGGYAEGRRSLSNWDMFGLRRPAKISDGSNGCLAIDHYTKYKEDVALMKKLGLDTYRLSLSWSRILPGGRLSAGVNREGVKFYNDLINLLLDEGIEPFVTIFHFDVPQCLEDEYGGFLDSRIVQDFGEYADVCFFEFGDRVKYWITENEPWTFTHNGYITGNFPPAHGSSSSHDSEQCSGTKHQVFDMIENKLHGILDPKKKLHNNYRSAAGVDSSTYCGDRSVAGVDNSTYGGDAGTEPYIVAHNLIRAHAAAVDIYRKNYQAVQGGKIGVTNMTTWYDPYSDSHEDIDAASRAVDFMWGWFVAPIVTGDYPAVMRKRVKRRLPEFTPEEKKLVKGSYDFIGMNYYTTYWAAYKRNPHCYKPTYYTDQEVEFFTERHGIPIGEKAGSDWLYIVPYGIRSLLLHTKNKYHDPIIYITENGVDEKNDKTLSVTQARKDDYRIKFHQDHLAYVKEAIDKYHVRVKGYMLWSLFDNYEWAEGYTVRFGIYYVDFMNHLTRYPKHSAIWYMNFLHKKTLPVEEDEQNHTAKRKRDHC